MATGELTDDQKRKIVRAASAMPYGGRMENRLYLSDVTPERIAEWMQELGAILTGLADRTRQIEQERNLIKSDVAATRRLLGIS